MCVPVRSELSADPVVYGILLSDPELAVAAVGMAEFGPRLNRVLP
jgi:hypothetical protein